MDHKRCEVVVARVFGGMVVGIGGSEWGGSKTIQTYMERVRGDELDKRPMQGRHKPAKTCFFGDLCGCVFSVSSDFPSVSLLTSLQRACCFLGCSLFVFLYGFG